MDGAGHYDVIIIGSGAGGGTLAHRLAPSRLRILLLERGGWVPREQQNWSSRAVQAEGRYHTKEVWRDGRGRPLRPHTSYNVGGNTKFFGAALFRLRRRDFDALQHYDGVSPAWPFGYDELEPYYTEAEQIYAVRGDRGADPTEPSANSPYAHPPIPHEPRIQQLHDELEALGLQPFHTPLGVMLDGGQRGGACIRCATCDGYPCPVLAKSDAEVCCVTPALRHENVTLLTGARVERLETSATGRAVTGVVVALEECGTQRRERFSADVIVVSCGAINSAALLLRSASDRHPAGLANSSDLVGRHYMGHTNTVLMALSRCPNPTVFQKTLSLNDFYFGDDRFPLPMGHISFVGKLDRDTLAAGAPRFVPGAALELMARHSLDFWLTSEDLPDPGNRVTIDRHGGIVLSYRPNNLEPHRQLIGRLKAVLSSRRSCPVHGASCHVGAFARSLYIGQRIPLAGVAHQNGTLRAGTDPRSSVLDPHCRAHDLDNLYVVDGSFFPSSGAVNPALTIMANALRVGDHLMERLGVAGTHQAARRATGLLSLPIARTAC
jgi:choline dehydrogenase-like flavoprotein